MTKSELNEIVEGVMEDYDPDVYEVDEVSLQEMAEIYSIFLESAGGSAAQSEPEVGGADDSEWATAYDDYFEDGFIFPESFEISMEMEDEGMSVDYYITSVNGDVRYSCIINGQYSVDAYTDGDIMVIGSTTMPELGWVVGELESSDQVEDIIGLDLVSEFAGETADVASVTYLGSVKENGKVYDMLELKEADGTSPGTAYIDRESQNIYQLVMDIDGVEMIFVFEDLDEIYLPDEALEAEEITVDELVVFYSDALVTCVAKAMGVEY